jgi:hypothetical protein
MLTHSRRPQYLKEDMLGKGISGIAFVQKIADHGMGQFPNWVS